MNPSMGSGSGYPVTFQSADKVKSATDMEKLRIVHKGAYVLRGVYACRLCRKSGSYRKMLKELCRRK